MKRYLSIVLVAALILVCPGLASGYYDVGSAATDVSSASKGQLTNITLAASAIDGWTLTYGQRFSFNAVVGPRSKERGYVDGVNGRGANVRGGGVSQVATTLLLAVRDFGFMSVEDYMVYGDKFVQNYVWDGDLAVVTDYNNNHDFCFTSKYDGIVTIEAWVSGGQLNVALTGKLSSGSSSGSSGKSGGSYVTVGTGSTPMPSNGSQVTNIRLAYNAINGTYLSYGQKFSFNSIVGPRTSGNGFVSAINGRGVSVPGGGVAQVASTIYLATKWMDSITFDKIRTYGDRFTGGYVSDSADAIVTDYNAGTDLAFTYYGSQQLYISMYEMDGRLYCDVMEVSP